MRQWRTPVKKQFKRVISILTQLNKCSTRSHRSESLFTFAMALTRCSAANPTVSVSVSATQTQHSKSKKINKKTTTTTTKKKQLDSSSPKRLKSPGIRLVGCRIYDSENGKSCHQCRQKTRDFSVSCTNQIENKQCTFHFCHSCLSNRYGEKAEEVAVLGDWRCPRCRGVCNCSFCMKKRGCNPTGMLIHVAKANGFSSVSNMLENKRNASDQDQYQKEGNEKKKKKKANGKGHKIEIPLPKGTQLTKLANIDLPPEDIGHALQFLEFCETFGKVLDLKKGQPEILLRELACGSSRRRSAPSIVQFHVKLLSLIEESSGKKYSSWKSRSGSSWVEDLSQFISKSQYLMKDWLLDCSSLQPGGYEELNPSKKLRFLNFLCDEALGTAKLRSWIEEQNSEEQKIEKEKLIADKKKEKSMKKKLQDEVAKAILLNNGASLSLSEHEDLVSKIKAEASQALGRTLEEQKLPAMRSDPILCDANGHKLWKLRSCYSNKIDILLQEVCNTDLITFNEKWFAYDVQEKELVEKYISTLRKNNIKE